MTTKNPKTPTSLDDLAAMMNQGFTETQKHLDQRLGGMEQRLDRVEHIQKDMLEELTAPHTDVRYIRSTVGVLVKSDAAQDAAIQTLTARVTRLEKKVGLVN